MSSTKPDIISSTPPRRSFGLSAGDSALDDNDMTPAAAEPIQSKASRVLGRISFGQSQHRPSFAARWRGIIDEEGRLTDTPTSERPPIPSALQPSGEAYTTPLPALSMIVLSITMLGEFLSANVSTPFLLFMVKGFGQFNDDADIAFWTGILVSTFFLTQFLTSLLWATVADKHGRRVVLFTSLLGSAITCLVFGTSTSLHQAIVVRLLQGIFAGAVGVARGSVAFVTDASNEGRAYAILGFCWGLGGVAGAIIGGSFETPVAKWPGVFEQFPLFIKYPYLLPCGLAASVTFTGSVLSCFLDRDGGPREGAVRLSPEKVDTQRPTIIEEESTPLSPILEHSEPRDIVGSLRRKVSNKFSGYFALHDSPSSTPFSSNQPPVPLSSPRRDKTRTFSQTSRADGSAYGYSGGYRNRLASTVTNGTRRGSMASSLRRRRGSALDRPQTASEGGDLNFAQRLLMANENAVTNIADLWVAAAMNVDNENPFESDTEMGSDGESIDSLVGIGDEEEAIISSTPTRRTPMASRTDLASSPNPRSTLIRQTSIKFGPQIDSRRPSTSQQHSTPVRKMSSSLPQGLDSTPRRFSLTVPSIFAHPGVRTPDAVMDAQQLFVRSEEPVGGESLPPILESQRASQLDPTEEVVEEKAPSLASQLPILIIVQYGLLALHTTTHDQVFMSYLVTDYQAGGLNLDPGHFAQLIALMCLAQIFYQFYLYPNIGPPRGRFSHLAMFRIGSSLFIPSYLTVILYRAFATPDDDGNFIVMAALAFSTALRYCAITFAYTAISILLNYMTPPHVVGIANGIAQSIVSLARCFGPVLGGYLWSVTTQDNPSGFPIGFIACAGACIFAVVQSFMIR